MKNVKWELKRTGYRKMPGCAPEGSVSTAIEFCLESEAGDTVRMPPCQMVSDNFVDRSKGRFFDVGWANNASRHVLNFEQYAAMVEFSEERCSPEHGPDDCLGHASSAATAIAYVLNRRNPTAPEVTLSSEHPVIWQSENHLIFSRGAMTEVDLVVVRTPDRTGFRAPAYEFFMIQTGTEPETPEHAIRYSSDSWHQGFSSDEKTRIHAAATTLASLTQLNSVSHPDGLESLVYKPEWLHKIFTAAAETGVGALLWEKYVEILETRQSVSFYTETDIPWGAIYDAVECADPSKEMKGLIFSHLMSR